jgi:hypothetical protein
MKNSRNTKTMLFLWLFAVTLCAVVVILMILRGPAVAP